MNKRKTILLFVILAIAGALEVYGPSIWKAGGLYYAKYTARRALRNFSPEALKSMDTVPTMIELPKFDPDTQAVEVVDVDSYLVRIPRPDSTDNSRKFPAYVYGGFKVSIGHPISTLAPDAQAHQLHFKDFFELCDAADHTRLSGLDSAADLPSVQRFLSMIVIKAAQAPCVEEFDRSDLCGFISAPQDKVIKTEVFTPSFHAGCVVFFTDQGALTPAAVHQFLAVLHFEAKPPDAANPASRPAAGDRLDN